MIFLFPSLPPLALLVRQKEFLEPGISPVCYMSPPSSDMPKRPHLGVHTNKMSVPTCWLLLMWMSSSPYLASVLLQT